MRCVSCVHWARKNKGELTLEDIPLVKGELARALLESTLKMRRRIQAYEMATQDAPSGFSLDFIVPAFEQSDEVLETIEPKVTLTDLERPGFAAMVAFHFVGEARGDVPPASQGQHRSGCSRCGCDTQAWKCIRQKPYGCLKLQLRRLICPRVVVQVKDPLSVLPQLACEPDIFAVVRDQHMLAQQPVCLAAIHRGSSNADQRLTRFLRDDDVVLRRRLRGIRAKQVVEAALSSGAHRLHPLRTK